MPHRLIGTGHSRTHHRIPVVSVHVQGASHDSDNCEHVAGHYAVHMHQVLVVAQGTKSQTVLDTMQSACADVQACAQLSVQQQVQCSHLIWS